MTKDEKQSLLARTAELYDSLLLLRGDFAGKFASSSIETEFDSEYVKVLNDMGRIVGGLDILLDASTRKGGTT